MAVPKRRTSKSKKNMRRAHDKIVVSNLSTCSQCKKVKVPHYVCHSCGSYKGRSVIEIEAE